MDHKLLMNTLILMIERTQAPIKENESLKIMFRPSKRRTNMRGLLKKRNKNLPDLDVTV